MNHWLTVYRNQNQNYVLWITQNVYPIYKQNKHNLKIFKSDSICETVYKIQCHYTSIQNTCVELTKGQIS